MVEVRYRNDHHAGATPEARIQHPMRNSGGEEADHTIKSGDGVRRVYHNVHLSGSAKQHGPSAKGEGDIAGRPRGPANQGHGQ
jgi:hypothetical protein